MEKAYDLKALGEKIVAGGLPALKEVGEAEALHIYKSLKEWLKESAVISPTPVDNVVMSFIDNLDSLALPAIDKIDGQKDL
jgi:hypothetical protein